MVLAHVQNWLADMLSGSTRSDAAPALVPPPAAAKNRAPAPPPSAIPAAPHPHDPAAWSAERIKAAETVWGEGFLTPGGAEEILRLARPLGLSQTLSLLLVGAATGGPVYTVAAELGAWVSGFEVNPDLVALATQRGPKAGLGRRATIATWQPAAPQFRANFFTHGLALEPLRFAASPEKREALLAAIAAAIKPQGQLMLVEAVADTPLDPSDPVVARWLHLERRTITPPNEATLTRLMNRLGFDVRIVEDISARHTHETLHNWNEAVQALHGQTISRLQARELIAEVELWLLRMRLIRAGRLRLSRWHGIGKKALT